MTKIGNQISAHLQRHIVSGFAQPGVLWDEASALNGLLESVKMSGGNMSVKKAEKVLRRCDQILARAALNESSSQIPSGMR